MTTVSIYKTPNFSLVTTINLFFRKIISDYRKAREYRQTINELNRLSPKILDDIGISKANINSVVYSHIYSQCDK